MSQQNIALVSRWFDEVWNQRRSEAIEERVGGESVCHGDAGPMRGPEEFRQRQYLPLVAAFPDLRVTIEASVAQGDEVVVRWSACGTHSGDAMGMKATQRKVEFRGISWVRVEDGKMLEGWQHSNIPEVLRELAAG